MLDKSGIKNPLQGRLNQDSDQEDDDADKMFSGTSPEKPSITKALKTGGLKNNAIDTSNIKEAKYVKKKDIKDEGP